MATLSELRGLVTTIYSQQNLEKHYRVIDNVWMIELSCWGQWAVEALEQIEKASPSANQIQQYKAKLDNLFATNVTNRYILNQILNEWCDALDITLMTDQEYKEEQILFYLQSCVDDSVEAIH